MPPAFSLPLYQSKECDYNTTRPESRTRASYYTNQRNAITTQHIRGHCGFQRNYTNQRNAITTQLKAFKVGFSIDYTNQRNAITTQLILPINSSSIYYTNQRNAITTQLLSGRQKYA